MCRVQSLNHRSLNQKEVHFWVSMLSRDSYNDPIDSHDSKNQHEDGLILPGELCALRTANEWIKPMKNPSKQAGPGRKIGSIIGTSPAEMKEQAKSMLKDYLTPERNSTAHVSGRSKVRVRHAKPETAPMHPSREGSVPGNSTQAGRRSEKPTPLHRPETLSLFKPISAMYSLIGREVHREDILRNLGSVTRDLNPALVGAVQVICSDESEKECCDIFQRRFAQHFLPSLKFSNYCPLRLINMGNRYEWGAIRVADSHFRIQPGRGGFKLMVVKVNSHAAVASSPQGALYGRLSRYGWESNCCGALHSLLDGGQDPFCEELTEDFHSEGKTRRATLLDPERVDPSFRLLFAAIVNARLQARKAVIDLQDHKPVDASVCLILPCVTLNHSGRDTEIICGIYIADWLASEPAVSYCGLGTNPGDYQVEAVQSALYIRDGGSGTLRQARDHRRRIHSEWRRQQQPLPRDLLGSVIEKVDDLPAERAHEITGLVLRQLKKLEAAPVGVAA